MPAHWCIYKFMFYIYLIKYLFNISEYKAMLIKLLIYHINIDVYMYLYMYVCVYVCMYICVTPRVHILPQLVGAGLEPGIPVREAGALTSNAKGYSL